MKAAVLTNLKQIEIRQLPDPKIQNPQDVLLKIASVGICGSDVHYYLNGRIGDQVVEYPFVVGHECSAVVAEVGLDVTRLKPGDHVVVDPLISCGVCSQCAIGRFNTCVNSRFLGCPGQIAGSLSEFIVMPENCCYPIPIELDLDNAVFVEPLSIGIYARKLAGDLKGKNIGILGVGPIGMSVLLACQNADVTSIFITDKIDDRLDLAQKLGADWIGNPDKLDIVQEILTRKPTTVDILFECCGDQEAINQAVALLKPGGKLMIIGIPQIDQIMFDINKSRRKELCFQNVRRQNNCVQSAINFVEKNYNKISNLITHKFPLEETKEAFNLVSKYKDGVMKAIIQMN